MDGFHSNWTKPFFHINKGSEYFIEDFEILTTILSALKWRENNGRIKMVTDKIGADYYKKIGIEAIWDLGIEVQLDNIDKNINSNIFWAAGKIFSLKNQTSPCAMIDTDFIVWKTLSNKLKLSEISVIHKEPIINDIYPSKEYFNMNDKYEFNENWDWGVLPSNTAFTYINNNKFKEYYTDEAIRFMNGLKYGEDRISYMVFAEQRLLSICAEYMNIKVDELITLKELENNKQDYFTHLWGYKNILRKNFEKRKSFCIKCIARILKDFPEYEDMIAKIDVLNGYYNELLQKLK